MEQKSTITFWDAKGHPKETVKPETQEVEKKHSRPQDDVPTELIIHYIVKDYRRMFEKCQRFEPRLEKERDRVRELLHKLRARQIEVMTDEQQKKLLTNLTNKVEKDNVEIDALTKERDELKQKVERLTAQMEDIRSSRSAVVEAVTDDLQQKLDEANKRIKLLAQAVVEPSKADSVFLQQCTVHTIETDEDRKWMDGAMKQLEKAAMKLLAVEERLLKVEETIKDSVTGIDVTKAFKNLGKVVSNITSTLSHIECFMDKVGDIKIVDDEED